MISRLGSTPRRPGNGPSAHPRVAGDARSASPSQREAPAPARATPPPALRQEERARRPRSALALRPGDPGASRARANTRRGTGSSLSLDARVRVLPRRMATAASRCRRVCPASRSCTTSLPNNASAPTAAASGPASARKSASNSNMSPPQWSCSNTSARNMPARAAQANVVIAERLPEPIDKGLPGPGLLAHVAVSKYADHLAALSPRGDLQAVRSRDISLDDVRLDGRHRRVAGADRQADAEAGS